MELGNFARTMALWMVIGILVGSVMPEFGNLVARGLEIKSHYFNGYFLVVGILGILGFGLALYLRHW